MSVLTPVYMTTNTGTPKSEQSAAEYDRKHYPEAVYADGAAHYLGADDVAVDLLESDDEYDEYKALEGIDHQHQKSRRYAADERSEERDDVRCTDDHGNEQRIGYLQYAASDEAQNADYECVGELTRNEVAEGLIRELQNGVYTLCVFRLADTVQ